MKLGLRLEAELPKDGIATSNESAISVRFANIVGDMIETD